MADTATRQPTRRTPPDDRPADEVVKETIESIVIALTLAFVFRAFVVEAFVIPTGSMAPTLLGAHARAHCHQCGYVFMTEWPAKTRPPDSRPLAIPAGRGQTVLCPMCRYPYEVPAGAIWRAGDRILVQKYIYLIGGPQRWDVIVFKAPHQPDQNFIKRLIGLPNESICLLDGNVYVSGADQPWHIARKTDRLKVQRAVWQPIYDSRYIPLDGGVNDPGRFSYTWEVPWVADGENAAHWLIEGRRHYRYDSAEPGRISFDPDRSREDLPMSLFPYNQMPRGGAPRQEGIEAYPIEDVRLAVMLRPDRDGLTLRLRTTARLDDANEHGPQQLVVVIDPDGDVVLNKINPTTGDVTPLGQAAIAPLSPRRNTTVELWYVDQQASVWVDGDRLIEWSYDLPMEELARRDGPAPFPDVAVEVSGSPVTLQQVTLERDLYYASSLPMKPTARGGLVREHNGSAEGEPFELLGDEYFAMGDNSPMSEDGRFWEPATDWITQRYLDGRTRAGVVPGQLLIGRAFFVYFPAPLPMHEHARGVFPNFGDMRFIH